MAISVDNTTVVRWTGTPATGTDITSAAFTPADSSLLVVCVEADSATGSDITISVSGGSLTWTERIERSFGDTGGTEGYAGVWTAPVSTGASMTIAVRRTVGDGGTNRISAKAYLVTGQHASPIGASGEGSDTSNNITPTVFTSTGTNAYGFGSAVDWSANGTPASSDLTADADTYLGAISVIDGFKDLGGIGSKSMNFDAAGAGAATWNWAALEILAAAAAVAAKPFIASYESFYADDN